MRGRSDDETLQPIAQQEEQWCENQRRDIGIEPEQLMRKKRGEHRGCKQRAMGKIDDVQNAVYQRQAKCDKRIDGAGHQSVKHRGD